MSNQLAATLKTFQFNGQSVPLHMHDGLLDYLAHGLPPGGFLTAVLIGDLFEAFSRADRENSLAVCAYVAFLHNYCDHRSYGSKEKVKDWIDTKRKLRQSTPRQQQEKT